MMQLRHTEFVHVPAHTKNTDYASKYNAVADKMAREAAESI